MKIKKLSREDEKKMETFESYMEQNPRKIIPIGMAEFLEFAKKQYQSYDNVNADHGAEDKEEQEELVKDYIGESMEALLLFKKFME